MGVPVLERLVHTSKELIPSNLALMRIRVSGEWALQGNFLVDPNTSTFLSCYRTLAQAQAYDASAAGLNVFAVAVPSMVVPVWNVVLYPQGKGFWDHVSLESVEPFEFDPRLFPENTPIEAASS
jgi:hypothetical protein